MRLLKGLVIFLAIGGTLALVLAARAAPRPLTTIDRIQPAMNYAYVRVAGAVVGHPTRADNDGYLSFVIADASGQIRVSVYRSSPGPDATYARFSSRPGRGGSQKRCAFSFRSSRRAAAESATS